MSYEAHEVCAFGLLLKDLVTRMRKEAGDDSLDQDSYRMLQHIVLLCIGDKVTAAQRPSFSQVCAHLRE